MPKDTRNQNLCVRNKRIKDILTYIRAKKKLVYAKNGEVEISI